MRAPSPRTAARAFVTVAAVAAASWQAVPAKARQFDVVLHVRQPDGGEKSVSVSKFLFVYYDRRFVRHSTGFGKPGKLETRDLPREVQSLQSENPDRIKFGKIRRVVLEFKEEGGRRLLHLVTTLRSRRRKPVDWPGYFLRNANTSALPHFRGVVGGVLTDFPLPPFKEAESRNQEVLTEIDFVIPGPPRR